MARVHCRTAPFSLRRFSSFRDETSSPGWRPPPRCLFVSVSAVHSGSKRSSCARPGLNKLDRSGPHTPAFLHLGRLHAHDPKRRATVARVDFGPVFPRTSLVRLHFRACFRINSAQQMQSHLVCSPSHSILCRCRFTRTYCGWTDRTRSDVHGCHMACCSVREHHPCMHGYDSGRRAVFLRFQLGLRASECRCAMRRRLQWAIDLLRDVNRKRG